MVRHDNYFEGILQLRNVNDDIVEFVLGQFEKHDIGISKIEEVRNGFDIYSASNKFSRKIARKMAGEFGGEIKESPKLFSKSRLTSKNIYRLNVLYKGPELAKGEIVKVKDKIVIVSSVTKGVIKGVDLATGKRSSVLNESIKKLKPAKAMVVKLKPQIEIMHPETYQSVVPENTKKVKLNQEVDVVVYKNRIYMI
jgi:NMD protein affecting ribosome stability and mRNA decay